MPERPQPPSRGLKNGNDGSVSRSGSGPGLPPRQPSTRGGPPTSNKPVPGGNRPKPTPPARPGKKAGLVSPPPVGGGREDTPVNIPTGEGMSAREMADRIDREVPNV